MVATKAKKVSANVTDPVADLLTRIRNANIAYKDDTLAPVSKHARAILEILTTEGYIAGFTQEGEGAPHEHAGSVHATTAEHAMQNARDVYARRGKVVSLWVVPMTAIIASAPSDAGPLFDPGNDKAYRHPQFYKVPRGVRGL